MASYSSWFDARRNLEARRAAATEFLRTGVTRAVLGGTACYNTEECASGYACINNKCTFLGPQKVSETCGTGTATCGTECGKATPGIACLAQDCCGDRCCRYGPGYVVCNCGECPEPEKECSSFCTSFYQNNITSPLPDGCDGNYCDECETCSSDGLGGTKCQISNSGPCWCNVTRVCELCSDDGSWYPDQACWPCRPFTKCGVPTGKVYCSPGLNGSLALLQSITQDGVTKLIDEPCAECEQPPANCESLTYTESGNFNPSWPAPTAPSGYTNTKTGYLYNVVTNETTYFVNKCVEWTAPPACDGTSCKCNAECAACFKCDPATLKCVPNPSEPGC